MKDVKLRIFRLRRQLLVSLTPEQEQGFRAQLATVLRRRILPLLALTLAFELYNTLYLLYYTDFQLKSIPSRVYFGLYLVFILMAGVCIPFFRRRAKDETILRAQYIYAAFLLVWGLALTLYDQRVSTSTMVYVMMLICVAVLFYLPPGLSALFFAGAQLAFLLLLPMFQPAGRDNYGAFVNSSFLALSCVFISYSQYRTARLNYLNNWVIMAQNREILEKSAELDFVANHDPLTGLLNQRFLSTWLQGRFAGARPLEPLGVFMIDIDDFKQYNDSFGHLRGDECLKRVAGALQLQLESGRLFRVGGEEFLYLLPGPGPDDGRQVGQRLRCAVEQLRIDHSTPARTVTVSIGFAQGNPADAASWKQLLASADAALYRAKAQGKNQVVVHIENKPFSS